MSVTEVKSLWQEFEKAGHIASKAKSQTVTNECMHAGTQLTFCTLYSLAWGMVPPTIKTGLPISAKYSE